ncbi:MAG: globin-coupled sensor protein [Acidimicrobiales bacterium]
MHNLDAIHFGINESNLSRRREFVRLTAEDAVTLKEMIPWAQDHASAIARDFYDWQFSFRPTARFFSEFAEKRGVSVGDLRRNLEKAQAEYLVEVFTGAETEWGLAYFEKRLKVGVVHDQINLPFKWYVGSYAEYRRLVREALLRDFVSAPAPAAKKGTEAPDRAAQYEMVERVMASVEKVFNLDLQAIGDAFIGATLESVGLNVGDVVASAESDRLEHLDQVKQWSQILLSQAQALASDVMDSAVLGERVPGTIGNGFAGVVAKVQAVAGSVTSVSENIDSLAAAGEELTVTASEIANRSRDISRRAGDAVAIADEASHAVTRLDDSSEEVGKVVESIASVANQTNMLALNATIEAARAGEAGKGFAVVASEVKELANQTAAATDEIDAKIRRIRDEISNAVNLISSIVEHVRHVNDSQDAMSSAIGHQTNAVEELGRNLLAVSDAAAEIRAQVQMDSGLPRGHYTLT